MSKNKITVLLVEDEQTLAMIIKDTLEENDFIIHTANDGEEGHTGNTGKKSAWRLLQLEMLQCNPLHW